MTSPATEFCPQCYRDRPLAEFVSRKGDRFVRQCAACRSRYRGWESLSVSERRARMKPKPRTGIGFVVTFVARSGNRKTGPMPVSMTDMESCPMTCPMRDAGFTINLSADSLEHADELLERGIAPVAVVLPSDAPSSLSTPLGAAVVTCLAETQGLTCASCQLCSKADRHSVVGFRAHGQAKAIVSDLVQLGRRNVRRDLKPDNMPLSAPAEASA